jgi:hypothetical protein
MNMTHVLHLLSVFDFYTVCLLLVPSVDPLLHTILHLGEVSCLFHFTQFHFDIIVVWDGIGSV